MISRRFTFLFAFLLLAWLATPAGANATIPLCDGLPATVEGTTGTGGDDVIIGTPDDDTIYAGAGDDVVCGGGGSDYIIGGDGNDHIFGQNGRDTLDGSSGDDIIDGGPGADYIEGQDGRDRLFGQNGQDVLVGGPGPDYLDGGAKDDHILGGGGNDRIKGGTGHDRVFGGNGQDVINGQPGQDILLGGAGHDRLRGGPGIDRIKGQAGGDRIIGGTEFDFCSDVTTAFTQCESSKFIECGVQQYGGGVEVFWTNNDVNTITEVFRNGALQHREMSGDLFVDSRLQPFDEADFDGWSIRPGVPGAPASLRLPCSTEVERPPFSVNGCVVRDYLAQDGPGFVTEPGSFLVAIDVDPASPAGTAAYWDLLVSVDDGEFISVGRRTHPDFGEFNGVLGSAWRIELTPGVWQVQAVSDRGDVFPCYPNFVVIDEA